MQSIVQLRETISHLGHSLSDRITHDIIFHLCDYTHTYSVVIIEIKMLIKILLKILLYLYLCLGYQL